MRILRPVEAGAEDYSRVLLLWNDDLAEGFEKLCPAACEGDADTFIEVPSGWQLSWTSVIGPAAGTKIFLRQQAFVPAYGNNTDQAIIAEGPCHVRLESLQALVRLTEAAENPVIADTDVAAMRGAFDDLRGGLDHVHPFFKRFLGRHPDGEPCRAELIEEETAAQEATYRDLGDPFDPSSTAMTIQAGRLAWKGKEMTGREVRGYIRGLQRRINRLVEGG